jgi:hypothetical protein
MKVNNLIPMFLLTAMTGCAAISNLTSGDSQKTKLAVSNKLPSAQGEVITRPEDNGNTLVEVDVKHLADPSLIANGANTYVVWAHQPGQQDPQNLGALRVDKDLNGNFKAVTPYKNFDLFITAEPNQVVNKPTDENRLWAHIAR